VVLDLFNLAPVGCATVDHPRLQRLDQDLFNAVAAAASAAPRRRLNHNLHAEPDLVQRFLNVLQPGTYIRPHRHQRQIPGAGFECFLVLQGSIGLLLFDDAGQLIGRERLDSAGPLKGIELAEGCYHALVALSPDAVMFELKQGPYQPTADKDFLPGFPLEGTAEARDQERQWRELFPVEPHAADAAFAPISEEFQPGATARASCARATSAGTAASAAVVGHQL
jgi:cupin fold WbuC family metalloprotein